MGVLLGRLEDGVGLIAQREAWHWSRLSLQFPPRAFLLRASNRLRSVASTEAVPRSNLFAHRIDVEVPIPSTVLDDVVVVRAVPRHFVLDAPANREVDEHE